MTIVATNTKHVFRDEATGKFLFADETGCLDNGEYETELRAFDAMQRYAAVMLVGKDEPRCRTADALAFGENAWVYCREHVRPHMTGWCTVSVLRKEKLRALVEDDAYAECEQRGFKIYRG